MEKLQGIVEKIRFSTEVNGGKDSTSTNHVAVFEIANKSIEIYDTRNYLYLSRLSNNRCWSRLNICSYWHIYDSA